MVETYGNFDIKFFTDSECMELVDELLYEAHNFCQLFNGINIIKQNKFEGYSNALSLELYKIKDESECYDENNKVECFYCLGPKEQESEEGIDATSDEETEDTDNEIFNVNNKSKNWAGIGITIINTIVTKPIARTISLFFSISFSK